MKGWCKHSKKIESTEGVVVEEWLHLPVGHDFGSSCVDATKAREYTRVFTRRYEWRKDEQQSDEGRKVLPQDDIIPGRWD